MARNRRWELTRPTWTFFALQRGLDQTLAFRAKLVLVCSTDEQPVNGSPWHVIWSEPVLRDQRNRIAQVFDDLQPGKRTLK